MNVSSHGSPPESSNVSVTTESKNMDYLEITVAPDWNCVTPLNTEPSVRIRDVRTGTLWEIFITPDRVSTTVVCLGSSSEFFTLHLPYHGNFMFLASRNSQLLIVRFL